MLKDILKFIITGMPHSGTTLLADMFRKVPGLFSGFECGFLMHERPEDFLSSENRYFIIYYENLKNYWGLDDDDVRYAASAEEWKDVYVRLRERSGKINDKGTVLFDKTPHYIFHLDTVVERTEDVPIIVIIKDTRLQYWSFKKRKEKYYADLLRLFTDEFAEKLLKYSEEGKIHIVRYEELCLNQEEVARKLFDFTGFEFECDYLSFLSDARPHYGDGIEKQYVYAGRGNISPDEIKEIRSLVTHPLFYYDLDDPYDVSRDVAEPSYYLVPYHLQHRSKGYRLIKGGGLEIGALNQAAFVPAGCRVEYCDVMSREEALKHFPEHTLNDLVAVQHICDLDREGLAGFESDSVDFVVLNHVIEHVANPVKTVKEAFRIIKTGGHAVLSVFDKDLTHIKEYPSTEFRLLRYKYEINISEVSDAQYEDFVKRLHPEVFKRGGEDARMAIEKAKNRREHVNLWDSEAFRIFLDRAFDMLDISAEPVFESIGAENGFEYFSVWRKL